MSSFDARSRDEFLRVLEEARRAAQGDGEDAPAAAPAAAHGRGSGEFLRALEGMAGRVRAYVSTRLLAGLYSDTAAADPPEPEARPQAAAPPPPAPQPPPKSDHETVVEELHLTPGLSADDLKHLRRKFAMVNHPDRVAATARDQATRRMTIANVLIDEALRGKRVRAR